MIVVATPPTTAPATTPLTIEALAADAITPPTIAPTTAPVPILAPR